LAETFIALMKTMSNKKGLENQTVKTQKPTKK